MGKDKKAGGSLQDAAEYLRGRRERLCLDLKSDSQIDIIPTGSLIVDDVTGLGGWPRGRAVEISGKESSGKCLVGSTTICTGQGMVRLGDVVNSVKFDKERVAECNLPVSSFSGQEMIVCRTDKIMSMGRQPTVKIRTFRGFELEGGIHHRLCVMDPVHGLRWRYLGEVATGTWVAMGSGNNVFARQDVASENMDPKWARLLGYFYGMHKIEDLIFRCDDDAEVERFSELAEELLGVVGVASSYSVFSGQYIVGDDLCIRLFDALEDSGRVVSSVMRSSRKSFTEFIAGILTFRNIRYPDRLEFRFQSGGVVSDLQQMLQNVGILSGRFKSLSTQGYPEHVLYVSTREDLKALSEIAPGLGITEEILDRSRDRKNSYGGLLGWGVKKWCSRLPDVVSPELDGTSDFRNDVDRWIGSPWGVMDYVVQVSRGEEELWDFEVPDTHCYAAQGGFMNHNSTLAMATLREVTRMGMGGVFMDFERSYHLGYAKKMGIPDDEEQVIVVQPSDFEEGDEALAHLLDEVKDLGVIIVDSVPAMTPRKAMQEEVKRGPKKVRKIPGQGGQIGLQASLMSDFMSRVTKYIDETNCLLLLINQMRSKINIGNPWAASKGPEFDTPGGMALKFYLSIRVSLDIKGKEKAEEVGVSGEREKVDIGEWVRATAIKNKVACPYRKGLFYIEYGVGIDNYMTLLDLAVERGLIETQQNNSVYVCSSPEFKIKGRQNVVNEVRSNGSMAAGIAESLGLPTQYFEGH